MEPLYVFLDTNIFLHYQPFDQIRWSEVLKVPQIVLVIAPVVVRELDEHKDQHRLSTIRDRARIALRKIEQSVLGELDTQLPDDVELEYAREPTIDFEHHGLRRDISDDHLIASCLTHREVETGRDIFLISEDTGPRLKAVQCGFRAMRLPDKYKLPSALDSVEKDKRQLQQRVQQLENRLPRLKLAFADESNRFKAVIQRPIAWSEEEIQRQIARIKNKYGKRAKPRKKEPKQNDSPLSSWLQTPGIGSRIADDWSAISSEEIQRYNSQLDEFYDSYENYLRRYAQSKNLQYRTISLDIYLFNFGTAPAEDIDVFMHFPDGFSLHDADNKPQMPRRPGPPRQPQTQAEKMIDRYSIVENFSHRPFTTPYIPIPGNVSSPTIQRSNSYDVSFDIQRLKQHMSEPCEPLYITFDSFESATSFSIRYRVNAADLPDEVTGSLHVIVAQG